MREPVPRFPLFISLEGRPVLVVGGGMIAARRTRVLLSFGAVVTVVAPEISSDMQAILDCVTWQQQRYAAIDAAQGYVLVIAATNERSTNRQIGEDAVRRGIPVSVADCKEESTFWFPAVVHSGELVAGMVSVTGNHGAVKKAAEKIKKCLEEAP